MEIGVLSESCSLKITLNLGAKVLELEVRQRLVTAARHFNETSHGATLTIVDFAPFSYHYL